MPELAVEALRTYAAANPDAPTVVAMRAAQAELRAALDNLGASFREAFG